jgi:hypothetical protein
MQKVFSRAVREGDAVTVRALLADPRVDPAANNNHAIRWASKNGRTEAVRALLADPRVDPTADINWAIREASFYGRAGAVRALLADPRVDPRVAIRHSTWECARIIASDWIEQHYDLFQMYHPNIVQEYQARLRQCYAVAWVATQECGWIDVVEPVVKRLKCLL